MKPIVTELPGWDLKFADDFDDAWLDTKSWTVYDTHGHESVRGAKSAKQIIVENSTATFRVSEIGGVWTGSGVQCVASKQVYGRYLVRARYGHGNAKAVGLLWPSASGWPPEVDFIEYDASDPLHEYVSFTNHYDTDNKMQHAKVKQDSTSFHTYECVWLPDGIRYRIDGVPIATHTGHVPDQEMWLGLSNNLNRNGSRPDPGTVIDWDIDWISVFTPSADRLRKAFAAIRDY